MTSEINHIYHSWHAMGSNMQAWTRIIDTVRQNDLTHLNHCRQCHRTLHLNLNHCSVRLPFGSWTQMHHLKAYRCVKCKLWQPRSNALTQCIQC